MAYDKQKAHEYYMNYVKKGRLKGRKKSSKKKRTKKESSENLVGVSNSGLNEKGRVEAELLKQDLREQMNIALKSAKTPEQRQQIKREFSYKAIDAINELRSKPEFASPKSKKSTTSKSTSGGKSASTRASTASKSSSSSSSASSSASTKSSSSKDSGGSSEKSKTKVKQADAERLSSTIDTLSSKIDSLSAEQSVQVENILTNILDLLSMQTDLDASSLQTSLNTQIQSLRKKRESA